MREAAQILRNVTPGLFLVSRYSREMAAVPAACDVTGRLTQPPLQSRNRPDGVISTRSGSASLASPSAALTRGAVELRSHPALNE